MIDDLAMNRAPAATSPRRRREVGGSFGLMLPRKSAEPTNDRPSAINATGADRIWTSQPPILGPTTKDSALLPLTSEVPST